MQYIELIIAVVTLGLGILFELYWRRNDRKKINAYIEKIGGKVYAISKLTYREHIYSVKYYIGEEKLSKTVKFTFTQEEIWY